MINKLASTLVSKNSKENWTTEKWYSYLLKDAKSQSERNEIHEIFNRQTQL